MMTRAIIGMDISLRSTGLAAVLYPRGRTPRVLDWDIVETSLPDSMPARLDQIHRGVSSFIARQKESISVVATEAAVVVNNRKIALQLAQARGVALHACYAAGMRFFEDFIPAKIKQDATGDGGADKQEVADGVRQHVVCPPQALRDDVTDAIGATWSAQLRLRAQARDGRRRRGR